MYFVLCGTPSFIFFLKLFVIAQFFAFCMSILCSISASFLYCNLKVSLCLFVHFSLLHALFETLICFFIDVFLSVHS